MWGIDSTGKALPYVQRGVRKGENMTGIAREFMEDNQDQLKGISLKDAIAELTKASNVKDKDHIYSEGKKKTTIDLNKALEALMGRIKPGNTAKNPEPAPVKLALPPAEPAKVAPEEGKSPEPPKTETPAEPPKAETPAEPPKAEPQPAPDFKNNPSNIFDKRFRRQDKPEK